MEEQSEQAQTPEDKVRDCAQRGEVADFSSSRPQENDPERGHQWDEKRTVKAEFIRWLATEVGNPGLHSKGIRIKGARITGELDFEACRVELPLVLEGCYFERRVSFRNASLFSLNMKGSYLPYGIDGTEMRVRHDVVLDELSAKGEVRLLSAAIDGVLSCRGAHFENTNGEALNADGISVKGGVFLDQGFSA